MKQKIKHNIIGYILVLMATFAVLIQRNLSAGADLSTLKHQPIFYIIYSISIIYFFSVFAPYSSTSKKILSEEKLSIIAALLLLNFLLFNGNFLLFSHFTSWLLKFMVGLCLVFLVMPYKSFLPKFIVFPLYFIIGSSILLSIYFIAYLLPTYSILFASGVFFGITLLSFVPVFILFYCIYLIQSQQQPIHQLVSVIGIFLLIFLVSIYGWAWQKNDVQLAQFTSQELLQKTPVNGFTEKILMGEFTYDVFQNYWRNGKSGQIHKKHDPLVSIAFLFSNKNKISHATRVAILTEQFSDYKGAHQKVWQATLFKNQSVATTSEFKNWQWYFIVFLFPMLLISTYYKLNQTDY